MVVARGDGLTPYWRRKALGVAYGAHVIEWRSWRYREAIRVRDERWAADRAIWEADRPAREAREREWVASQARWQAFGRVPGLRFAYRKWRMSDWMREWAGVVSEERRDSESGPGVIVRVMGDFGDLWIE